MMGVASGGEWPRLPLRMIGRQESGGAEIEQFAIGAIGFPGGATAAPMPDQPMTELGPGLAREDQRELEFDLLGLMLAAETQALRKA